MKIRMRGLKREDIMIVRRSVDEIKPELTKEQIEQLECAERMPVIFDEYYPEFTDEMAKYKSCQNAGV